MRHSPRARGVFSRIRQTALRRDPEPHLAAVGVELGPVPEGPPVGFPAGGARRQATWTGCWAGYRRTAGQPRSDGPGPAVRGRGTFVSHRLRLAVSESDQLAVARGSLDGVVAGLLFVAGMRRSEVSALPLVPTSSTRPAGRGQPVSPPLGILCAEPGRGVPL